MMLSIEEKERTQCRFAAFCKVVFRNAICTYFRDLGRKRKHEISFEYLAEQTSFEVCSTDDYFVCIDKPTDFTIYGQVDTASLLAIQQRYKTYIAYLSHGDTDLNDLLNSKLLEAILKFKMDYQPPSDYHH